MYTLPYIFFVKRFQRFLQFALHTVYHHGNNMHGITFTQDLSRIKILYRYYDTNYLKEVTPSLESQK
jgi:hypothetical protein